MTELFRVSGRTSLGYIVGDPIEQVKSPILLSEKMQQRGYETLVLPAHVRAGHFAEFLCGAAALENLTGIVVTIPHKFAAYDACDVMDSRATFTGSVNVIRRERGAWHGFNVDGIGFLNGVEARSGPVRGKRVLLAGAGGAGSPIALEFLLRGADHVAVFDQDGTRQAGLVAKLEKRFPGSVSLSGPSPEGFDIVANATPAGMGGNGQIAIDADRLSPDQFVADVVTAPAMTPLLLCAQTMGCTFMGGVGMTEGQAEELIRCLLRLDEENGVAGEAAQA